MRSVTPVALKSGWARSVAIPDETGSALNS